MKRNSVWIGFILIAAFALRLYRLGVTSLWYDETVSTFLSQQDLVSLTRHTAGDIHPPAYYYLLHFWGQVAGWSEFSFAFFSLFFGVLLVALAYRVAREWFNRQVALIAAFLIMLSPYNIWYSQEVRMYTLGATLGLASVYFLVRLLKLSAPYSRQPLVSRDLILYAVISALGLYTLYYFAFLLAFENLVALIWLVQRSRIPFSALRTWFTSQLATLVLFAPWLPIAARQALDPPVPPWRTFTDVPKALLDSFSALAFGQSVEPGIVAPMLFVIAVLITLALWRNPRSSIVSSWFLLGYTLVPLSIIFGLSVWVPLYHVRYVFPYSPAFYILLALGLYRIANSKWQKANYGTRITHHTPRLTFYALLAMIAATCIYSSYNFWFDPKYADDDLRGAARYIAEHWRPGDAVLVNAGYTYTAFVYYFNQPIAWRGRLKDYASQDAPQDARAGAVVLQTGSIGGAVNLGWNNPESDFYPTTAGETRAALDRVFAAHLRVWQFRLYDTVVDPAGVIRTYLADRARIIDDAGFAGQSYPRAQGYLTTRAPQSLPPNLAQRDVVLGNRIVLLGFSPAIATARAGAPLDVDVYWQAKEPTNVAAHMFVALFAGDGNQVASADDVPLGNALGTSRWSPGEILREPIRLMIPATVAPGNYVLRGVLYNPLTNEPLDTVPGQWVNANGQIELTQVRVE